MVKTNLTRPSKSDSIHLSRRDFTSLFLFLFIAIGFWADDSSPLIKFFNFFPVSEIKFRIPAESTRVLASHEIIREDEGLIRDNSDQDELQTPIEYCGDMSEDLEVSPDFEIRDPQDQKSFSLFRVEARRIKQKYRGTYVFQIAVCDLQTQNRSNLDVGICKACQPAFSFTRVNSNYIVKNSEEIKDIQQQIRKYLQSNSTEGRHRESGSDDEDFWLTREYDTEPTVSSEPHRRFQSGELARSRRGNNEMRTNSYSERYREGDDGGEYRRYKSRLAQQRDERTRADVGFIPEDGFEYEEDYYDHPGELALSKEVKKCSKMRSDTDCKIRALSSVIKKYNKSRRDFLPESIVTNFYDSHISPSIIEQVANRDSDAISTVEELLSVLNRNYKDLLTRVQNDINTGVTQAVNQEKAELRSQLDAKVADLGIQSQNFQNMGRPDLAMAMNMQAMRIQQDPTVQRALLWPEINQFSGFYNDFGGRLQSSLNSNTDLGRANSISFYNDYLTKTRASLQSLTQFPIPASTSVGALSGNSFVASPGTSYNQFGTTDLNNNSGSFMTSPITGLPGIAGNGISNSSMGPIPMPSNTPVNGQLVPAGQLTTTNGNLVTSQPLPLGVNSPGQYYDPTMGLGGPNRSIGGNYPMTNTINMGPRGSLSNGTMAPQQGFSRGRQ